MTPVRELLFFEDYFKRFFDKQSDKVREKINQVFYLLTHVERVPEKFLKKLIGHKGLYEIRIESGGNIFRIFCCFDNGNIIVLLNGFQKKSMKTPISEIGRAIRLMDLYFNNKRT